MYIDSITLKGFQSAGEEPHPISLTKDITTFVGANGVGKTAVLEALLRLFGVSEAQRRVQFSDFHIDQNKTRDDYEKLDLWLDVILVFPELEEDAESLAVPPCFKHMLVDHAGKAPYCRIRLEASWEKDATIDGTIEQQIYWIHSCEQPPTEEDKTRLSASDRSLVQVHYIPAARSENELVKQATKVMKKRLFKAIEWSSEFNDNLKQSAKMLSDTLAKEKAIKHTNEVLQTNWLELTNSKLLASPEIGTISGDIKDFVNKLTINLQPTEDGGTRPFDELSDGYTSLFYFALTAAVFDIEHEVSSTCTLPEDQGPSHGFCSALLPFPALTVFAVEEPENHLAPYYLSRIINSIQRLAKRTVAQAIITSHSSSILSRIQPENVRHFRLSPERTTIVRKITLPDDDVEAAKFMKEAVLAYPELYFAHVVILCEGDSEQIVIPRLAKAMGVDLDPAFVAVVPLGGRHVNHFWRLLNNLGIPHATLIDLDLGRETGGWDRLGLIYYKLLEKGTSDAILQTEQGHKIPIEGKKCIFPQNYNVESVKKWAEHVQPYGMFFSWPLDIDMSMLAAFYDSYTKLPEGSTGPKVSKTDPATSVLKQEGDVTWYQGEIQNLQNYFLFYRYLFLGKSKPVTHLEALKEISDDDLSKNAPKELKALIKYVHEKLEGAR